jgi:putative transposase
VLITHEKLAVLVGYQNYNSFRESHLEWVNESLASSNNIRDSRWTRSIAVGSEQFVKRIKAGLSTKALGRKIREVHGGYELREGVASYITDLVSKLQKIDSPNRKLQLSQISDSGIAC